MNKLKRIIGLIMIGGLLLAGCSNKNEQESVEPGLTPNEMVDQMLAKVEQPMLMELTEDQLKDTYNIDPAKLEAYAIRIPMMNVKANEIAILKVKDEADIPEVEDALKNRAENVQKQFETYLPDQYENAKNYKLVTKGKYVLLVISESADELLAVYEGFFKQS